MTTQMELSSLFKLVTKSGHPSLDAVKSAIQKYARRGMPTEMLQAVYEMDAFRAFDDSDIPTTKRTAKAIRTNMINRLKVILFEDVSFSQVGAFITVAEKIKEWEDEGRSDKNTLADIVSILAHAKKLRLPSYLYASYGTGADCAMDKKDFLDGIDKQKVSCLEWIYHNDKEALKMLTSSDHRFPGKEHILPLITSEWKRLKPTKSKDGSTERFMFVVVPWLWIMYGDHLNEMNGANPPSFDKKEVKAAYKKTDVQFEDYVYDKHTQEGKKRAKTVEDFRAEGALVTNEDDIWLYQFEELKDYYNNQPEVSVKAKKPRKLTDEQKAKKEAKEAKPKRLRRGGVKAEGVKEIDIDVGDVELILEGVCAAKLPCGYVCIKGKDKVIKPMNKGLNYGLDYVYIDRQKRLFGLRDLDIKLRKIPGKKLTLKITKEQGEDKHGKPKIVKHKSYEWEDSDEGQVVAIMTKVSVKGDLGKCKDLLKDEAKFREMLKIRLFNGFFRTSDNILRNILVDEDDQLWAIDENDIYGKRKNVFNKNEPVRNSPLLTAVLVDSVIEELDFPTHEETLVAEMGKYFPKASCEYYERELRDRVRNYKQIVLKELKLD